MPTLKGKQSQPKMAWVAGAIAIIIALTWLSFWGVTRLLENRSQNPNSENDSFPTSEDLDNIETLER